jgi:hypothetical protein
MRARESGGGAGERKRQRERERESERQAHTLLRVREPVLSEHNISIPVISSIAPRCPRC